MKKLNYIGMVEKCCMIIGCIAFNSFSKSIAVLLILFALHKLEAKAQDNLIEEKVDASFAYDGIPVLVIVSEYKSFYVDAIYANNDLLYVNIQDLFKTLNILCITGPKGDSISGFIENESQTYLVNYNNGQLRVGDKTVNSQEGLIKEKGILYLESSLFAEAFGITLTFNYRALTLILKSNFELPIIKQQRIEKLRGNISKVKGEQIADTAVKRNYHIFKFGTLDWSIGSYQTWNISTDNRFGIGIGSELLYGEANVSVNYYSQQKFDNRQLYYLWRWVDNEKTIIKQAQVGRISNQTISFINSPVIGAIIRNSPTTVRKATGYYTLNEMTEPNWTVELYINNVMVDYTKADASGLFVFKIPNVYGYTTLKLKFYGPLGEERTEERTMNIPFSIMPNHEFEYGLSAGIIQDSSSSRFGRGEFNYGANDFLTLGGGLEYLSSIPNGAFIPFAKATIQPYSKLTLNMEYAFGVKMRGVLDYYFWKDALVEVDYIKYVDGQLATRFNANEERKVKLSIPFRYRKIIGFSKFDYTQFVYKTLNYNQSSVIVSVYYKQFSANSTTQFNWIDNKTAYITSDLSLSYRLGKGYTIRPSSQYNLSEGIFMSYKVAVEKSIPRGYFTASYERNILYNDNFVSLNFKYDLSFAKTNISASHSNNLIYTSESAQGSLAFGSGNNYVHVSNNISVGKGGISLYPFLDLNQNGIFDKGEHMVKLSSVKIMGSKAIFSEKDSIVRIPDLIPFTKYILELDDNDLENISWRFKNKTYEVLIDPNQFKRIDIPVITVGEFSGMVYMNQDNTMNGIGRINVKFYKKNSTEVVAETLSESDGYFDYIGFSPGEYVASFDSVQLSNLNLTIVPQQIEFKINQLEDGDVVRGVDFALNNRTINEGSNVDKLTQHNANEDVNIFHGIGGSKDSKIILKPQNQTIKDSTEILTDRLTINKTIQTLVWGELCDTYGNYFIQCGAFKYISNAMRMALYIKQNTNLKVGIALQNGLYKVRVECVPKKMNAEEIKGKLKTKSISDDMFIVIRK